MKKVKVKNLSRVIFYGMLDGKQIPIHPSKYAIVEDTQDIRDKEKSYIASVKKVAEAKVIEKAGTPKKLVSNDEETAPKTKNKQGGK